MADDKTWQLALLDQFAGKDDFTALLGNRVTSAKRRRAADPLALRA